MSRSKYRKFKKLSADIPAASLTNTEDKLSELHQFKDACFNISEDLSLVVKKIRQVAAPDNQPFVFTQSLKDNEQILRSVFRDCDDIKFRLFSVGKRQALLVFLDGMTDTKKLEDNVLSVLMSQANQDKISDIRVIASKLVTASSIDIVQNASFAIHAVMSGNALLIIDQIAEPLSICTAKYVKRPVEYPQNEIILRGPNEAFNETIADNIVLIRRRTHDTNVKVVISHLGERTKTTIAVIYVANLVKPGLVEEVQRRLNLIKIDKLLTASIIEDWLVDHPWSPFPQIQTTERPDKLIAALYEGRLAILAENTPAAMILPSTLKSFLQSVDDYTLQPLVGSSIRLIRHTAMYIAIYLPSLYIGVVSFHPGMLPTSLAISIAELRMRTPFPTLMESLMMEFLLDIFQEAIVRLPQKVSGAAGVVGALVIGNTVVQAGLINPLLVVIIASTAIASFCMPAYAFGLSFRILRVLMLLLASILGLYGVMLGFMVITLYMMSLESFGESFYGGIFDLTLLDDWKDTFISVPTKLLDKRPKEYGAQDKKRTGDNNDGS